MDINVSRSYEEASGVDRLSFALAYKSVDDGEVDDSGMALESCRCGSDSAAITRAGSLVGSFSVCDVNLSRN